jgi:2-C-methyl-D-erythritol 2,4-cyclodiphosphate synthase
MRIGIGYDVHPLVVGRPLIIGGVTVPFDKGLRGHSDADVLSHAVCDALLGAAALGDIGLHFPDTDPRYKGIRSLELVRQTAAMIRESGYTVVNLDTVIMAEAPKFAPYRSAIQANLAEALGIPCNAVSIKATTTEKLGAIGRGEGIAATCVALITVDIPNGSAD